jgi:hypothetical protein
LEAILSISKKAPESKAKDFAYLKEEGINYIQEAAGNHWTDYNTHDPGITLLEVLSYAINDLANRTSFDIKDLLVEDNGPGGQQTHFFTPDKILPTNPVTINDLRRVIIDVPGIKNAWVEPKTDSQFHSDGPLVYQHPEKGQLTYESEANQTPLSFIGLYDILLEFEHHPDFGDLNSNTVRLPLEINDTESELNGFKAMLSATFPYWDDALFPDTDTSHLSVAQLSEYKVNLLLDSLQDVDMTLYRGYDKFRISLEDLKDVPAGNGQVKVADRITGEPLEALETELREAIAAVLSQLTEKYFNKVLWVRNLIKTVNTRLQRYRNLCEDFINFKSLKVKELALCIKVDLKHDAVPDKVLSRLFHELEAFLAPPLAWSSLKELLDRHMPIDEIFEGPLLDHGFLPDSQMEISDRRKIIYISDLINVIQDIPGIAFIGEIEVGLKDGREFKLHQGIDQWHVTLDDSKLQDYFIPRLNIDHSNIRFYKNEIPLATNRDEVNSQLEQLRAAATATRQIHEAYNFATSAGTSRGVGAYASIQEDLPLTYGIGEYGLATTASDDRKARAQQLKGYLLIFEQLLVNYLAQLKNVNQLFSLDTNIDRTYFVQDLYEVPNLATLLTDFLAEAGTTENPAEDDRAALRSQWSDFMENTENAYLQHVRDIAEGTRKNASGETESVFLNRRNRFLDHLMARFGEQIDDYANIMHSIDSDVSGYQLIEDKSLLLQDYPEISANRSKGFNYLADAEQQSGLEMRIARLLGIASDKEQANRVTFEIVRNNKGHYSFRLKNQADQIILRGVEFYEKEETLNEVKTHLMEEGLEPDNYHLKTFENGQFQFELRIAGKPIAISKKQDGHPDKRMEQIMRCIDQLRMADEQVLVIEHLLLRPRLINRDALLPAYQVTDNYGDAICCPGNADPYSFIVSIVLPSWPVRFRNIDFRRYVEEKIRLETPAHIFAKICWVKRETMTALDESLSQWKSAMAGVDFNDEQFISGLQDRSVDTLLSNELEGFPAEAESRQERVEAATGILSEQSTAEDITAEVRKDYMRKADRLEKMSKLLERSDKHNELIAAIKTMRNVYPTATLYNCQDGSADNPIALNKTNLGTFKPLEDE